MGTSNFFSSRGNIVGMVLAILVIVLHLVVGLGALWPVVAVAGYGAGLLLTPRAGQPELEQPSRPAIGENPDDLRYMTNRMVELLRANRVPVEVSDALNNLDRSLNRVLANWHHLTDFPEHQVTVRSIVVDYVPSLVESYLNIPDLTLPRAVDDIVSSFGFLRSEADSIYDGIMENNLAKLEDHRNLLRLQFGRLPTSLDLDGGVDGDVPGEDPEPPPWEHRP